MQDLNEQNQRLIAEIKAMIIEAAACVEFITKPSTTKWLLRTVRSAWKTTDKSERLQILQGYVTQMQNYPLSAEIQQHNIDALVQLIDEIDLAYSVWWKKALETEEEISKKDDKKVKEDRLKVLLIAIKNQLGDLEALELPPAAVVPAPGVAAAVIAAPQALQSFGTVPATVNAAQPPAPTRDVTVFPFAAVRSIPLRAPELIPVLDLDGFNNYGAQFEPVPVAPDDEGANDNAHYVPFVAPLLDNPAAANPAAAKPMTEDYSIAQLCATLRSLPDEEDYDDEQPDVRPLIDYSKPQLEWVRDEMQKKAELRKKNEASKATAMSNNNSTEAPQPQVEASIASKISFFAAKAESSTPAINAPAKTPSPAKPQAKAPSAAAKAPSPGKAPAKATSPGKATAPAKTPSPGKAPAADSEAKAPANAVTLAPSADTESEKASPNFG